MSKQTMSVKKFNAINLGDVFEAGTLLQGVTDEPVVWACTSVDIGGRGKKTFELFYFNTKITTVIGQVEEKQVTFTEV